MAILTVTDSAYGANWNRCAYLQEKWVLSCSPGTYVFLSDFDILVEGVLLTLHLFLLNYFSHYYKTKINRFRLLSFYERIVTDWELSWRVLCRIYGENLSNGKIAYGTRTSSILPHKIDRRWKSRKKKNPLSILLRTKFSHRFDYVSFNSSYSPISIFPLILVVVFLISFPDSRKFFIFFSLIN